MSWITWLLTLIFGFHEVLGDWPALVTVLLVFLTRYPSLLNVVYTILLLTNHVRGVRKWSCRKHRLCWKMSQNLWFSWRQHKQMSVLRLGRSLFRSLLKRLPDLKGRFLYYLLQPSLFASSVLFCRIRHTLVKQHICDVSSVSTHNKQIEFAVCTVSQCRWNTTPTIQFGFQCRSSSLYKGWRMVKSKTRRDAKILVRNPSSRLFGKSFRDSKKVKSNHAKTRLRDLSKTLPRFRDPAKIFRDSRFSRYHSPPLLYAILTEKKTS